MLKDILLEVLKKKRTAIQQKKAEEKYEGIGVDETPKEYKARIAAEEEKATKAKASHKKSSTKYREINKNINWKLKYEKLYKHITASFSAPRYKGEFWYFEDENDSNVHYPIIKAIRDEFGRSRPIRGVLDGGNTRIVTFNNTDYTDAKDILDKKVEQKLEANGITIGGRNGVIYQDGEVVDDSIEFEDGKLKLRDGTKVRLKTGEVVESTLILYNVIDIVSEYLENNKTLEELSETLGLPLK